LAVTKLATTASSAYRIVEESSFPVHQTDAVSVEKDIVWLGQVVVTRHHIRIVMWVDRSQLRVPGEKFLAFGFWKNFPRLKPLDESIKGSPFV
jgi:hypothetical protein